MFICPSVHATWRGEEPLFFGDNYYLFFGSCLGNHPFMNDLLRTSERRKSPCVHSPAIPRRFARSVAVIRRDRVVNPPRTDRPPAEPGT